METVEIEVNPKEISSSSPLQCRVGNKYYITILNNTDLEFIEFDDALFRTNCSCFIPVRPESQNSTQNIDGIILIANTLYHIEKNEHLHFFVTGHTDTVGQDSDNEELSFQRARCVYSLLVGDRDAFSDASFGPYFSGKEERIKQQLPDHLKILEWVSDKFGWGCSHSECNNDYFKAVKTFQRKYNEENHAGNKDGTDLNVDGDWGKMVWGAVFDCYQTELAAYLKISIAELIDYRSEINLSSRCLGTGNVLFGKCGEYHPIEAPLKDSYRSQTNRRVEILLFRKETLTKPTCLSGTCNKSECKVFNTKVHPRKPIPLEVEIPEKNIFFFFDPIIDESFNNSKHQLKGISSTFNQERGAAEAINCQDEYKALKFSGMKRTDKFDFFQEKGTDQSRKLNNVTFNEFAIGSKTLEKHPEIIAQHGSKAKVFDSRGDILKVNETKDANSPDSMKEYVKAPLDEDRAWFCFNRMGNLASHGQKIRSIIRYQLKEKCTIFFDNGWMKDPIFLEELAGFVPRTGIPYDPSGAEILQEIEKNLPDGVAKRMINDALAVRLDPSAGNNKTAPVVAPTAAEQAIIDKINKAINADPKKGFLAAYYNFPVTMYSPGRAVEGGLYYFPNLNADGKAKTIMRRKNKNSKSAEMSESIYPMIYTLLGDTIKNRSDEYIRSAIFHESVHIRQYLSFRSLKKDRTPEVEALENRLIQSKGTSADLEVEACAEQMSEYYDTLGDKDMSTILVYYSTFMANAVDPQRENSIWTIVRKVKTSKARKLRCLHLIDSLNKTARKQLSDLRKEVDEATVGP